MGAILQAGEVLWIVAPLPAVEGLGGDAKVAAGESGIVAMSPIVVKPFESLPGLPG